MLRLGHEHLTPQRAFEVEAQVRVDAASLRRQDEKMCLEAAEVRTLFLARAMRGRSPKELRYQAEKLAEERCIAREQALEWTGETWVARGKQRERKAKHTLKKVRTEIKSGDKTIDGGEPKEGKGKPKKVNDEEEENGQLFSDLFVHVYDGEARHQRGSSKTTMKKKHGVYHVKSSIKSKEYFSDTDDEMIRSCVPLFVFRLFVAACP
ncbi:hypothetical protein EDD16DRAFT_1518112 [Pisolithus croceorrhizus]|nr:hypothetical protein EDD16DRAFT_1518112 [Pisolithus croceorrhizus]KAI6166000.1 hypothetical protein EDD17DRAFT_1505473 [Pisolithus thermaeus]